MIEENYVEYPPNTIYVLTKLKSGSNALPGEISKISKISIFCDAQCDTIDETQVMTQTRQLTRI